LTKAIIDICSVPEQPICLCMVDVCLRGWQNA
jgi:hypothetical protein